MTDSHDNTLGNGAGGEQPAREVDLLVGRFVDGEAGADDVERFTALVGPRDQAALRALLESKRDHALLRDQVGLELLSADEVDLPAAGGARLAFISRGGGAYLGWAAAIILAAFIFFVDDKNAPSVRVIDQEKIAPHIVGEREMGALPPMLRSTRKLPDGRFLLEIVERRARQIYLDELDDAWITDELNEPRLDTPRPPPDL